MATLGDYLTTTRDLLNDPDAQYWSTARLTRFINRALIKRDRDTGQNRQTATLTSTVGVDTYTFATLQALLASTTFIIYDVIAVNLIYGTLRVVLGSYSFTMLNVLIRQYQPLLRNAPVAWAKYGANKVVIAPAPATAHQIEFDCALTVPNDYLVASTDADPLPLPYTDPPPYYAAHLAKLNERKYEEAQSFLDDYQREILTCSSTLVGTVPSLYR